MTHPSTRGLSRRRFLTISAAVGVCAAAPVAATPLARWEGRALGAQTSMLLVGLNERDASPIFQAVENELTRLERIFSLYVPESQLVQLNAAGVLKNPAPELLNVLSLCGRLHSAAGGAFDPTLQPLWMAHAAAASRGEALSPDEDASMRALIGWDRVRFDTNAVQLPVAGMALTLNGVAQGFVTDRISALLRRRGVHDVVIDLGEIAALGRRPDGTAWSAGITTPGGEVVKRVVLKDRALATSAPSGTLLNADSGTFHILDPRGAVSSPMNQLVSVSSTQAAVADGLSTAGCLMDVTDLTAAIGTFPNSTLETLS